MDLGKKIKIINKDKKQLFATLALIFISIVVINAVLTLHMNENINFNVGKYEYLIISGLIFISILSAIATYKKWPEYSFVLYRKGVKAIGKKKEVFIHFKDIEEMLMIPQESNLGLRIVALAFKTDDSPWMIIGPGHKYQDLNNFKESYENYIYSFFLNDLKNGKNINFNYLDNNLINKKRIIDNKEFQSILDKFDNSEKSITINNRNIQLEGEIYPISHIDKITESSIDKVEILNSENITLFEFNKYTISNEDIFKVLIKESIKFNTETLL